MAEVRPTTDLDQRFSENDVEPTTWDEGRSAIEQAEIFWLTTVRPDGRPHVTPLLSVWHDGAAYFCTGPEEQKGKNLASNPHCVLTTGGNARLEGLDIVIEADAVRVVEDETLLELAGLYESKYGKEWHFDVRNGAFVNDVGGDAYVYELAPQKAFGFKKGPYSQTRWRFPSR